MQATGGSGAILQTRSSTSVVPLQEAGIPPAPDAWPTGSMQVQISADFAIDNTQWGLVNSGALIVATILYPIWGYLYDHYARAKLLALASLIWGATTWMNAIVRSFGGFLVTRASTGIDDSSYPGVYTLIADYFGPGLRGKVYGILQLAQPIGYLLGMILALMVAPAIGGWRAVFLITGSLGLAIAVLIFFFVKEMPRGKAEPEFENLAEMRSTAQAVEYFVENAGAAFAPVLTGLIADAVDIKTAILLICTVAWGLCFLFYLGAIFTIDKDARHLRDQMAQRAGSINTAS
jgi:MFS family permease